MIEQSSHNENTNLFKPAQFLGSPRVFPPPLEGKIQAAVQFIVSNLHIENKDKNTISQLAKNCKIDVRGVDFQLVANQRTGDKAALFTFAFYVTNEKTKNENDMVMSIGRLLVERFLSLLSFYFGTKLGAMHVQYTTSGEKGGYKQILPVISRSSQPPIKIDLLKVTKLVPSEEVFSALFWLRRGLAERDPIENYSALMVCLQIIANQLIPDETIVKSCPSCGVELGYQPLSITQ